MTFKEASDLQNTFPFQKSTVSTTGEVATPRAVRPEGERVRDLTKNSAAAPVLEAYGDGLKRDAEQILRDLRLRD